jgi:hypothetical protein
VLPEVAAIISAKVNFNRRFVTLTNSLLAAQVEADAVDGGFHAVG